MARKRVKQLSLAYQGEKIACLARGKRRELVDALAELLLNAARRGNEAEREERIDQGRPDDEHEDHR